VNFVWSRGWEIMAKGACSFFFRFKDKNNNEGGNCFSGAFHFMVTGFALRLRLSSSIVHCGSARGLLIREQEKKFAEVAVNELRPFYHRENSNGRTHFISSPLAERRFRCHLASCLGVLLEFLYV
jgi:hypothetical protein